MKFVDSVKIHVRSGKGGSGCTSFRREKYIPMGGPDGGDGGKGGDIYFVGDQNRNTLLDLSFQQHQHAGNGSNGMGKDRHGKNGQDLKIHVPLGTMLKEQETYCSRFLNQRNTCSSKAGVAVGETQDSKLLPIVHPSITNPGKKGWNAGFSLN